MRVICIGAGFAGVGLGVKLLEAGVTDFEILERNDSVGGTWFEHTYPGCACDIPAHLYSFSFARNPDWKRIFPRQEEILAYVRRVADERGVTPHISFGCEMTKAEWDGDVWRLETSDGPKECDVLVSAIGATAEPDEPDIPGLTEFEGHRFHSARWDHAHDLRGERVAVIGTGPAAAQFVPRIQPEVERLDVFMRTPPWVFPHPDRPVPWVERAAYKVFPPAQDAQRNAIFAALEAFGVGFRSQALLEPMEAIGRLHLRRQVSDPVLREALTPRYRVGCKRPIMSNSFYPALAADNTRVVTDGIERVDRDAIVTRAGERIAVDTIITAIGYKYSRSLLVDRLVGADGRTLGDVWQQSPKAYLGTTVPGFPNLFILLGPNAIGINSVIFSLEAQIAYVLDALDTMERDGVAQVEVKTEALEAYVEEVDSRSAGSVWTDGGCHAYYLDDAGRNIAIYPGFVTGYRRRTRRFDPDRYETVYSAGSTEAVRAM